MRLGGGQSLAGQRVQLAQGRAIHRGYQVGSFVWPPVAVMQLNGVEMGMGWGRK